MAGKPTIRLVQNNNGRKKGKKASFENHRSMKTSQKRNIGHASQKTKISGDTIQKRIFGIKRKDVDEETKAIYGDAFVSFFNDKRKKYEDKHPEWRLPRLTLAITFAWYRASESKRLKYLQRAEKQVKDREVKMNKNESSHHSWFSFAEEESPEYVGAPQQQQGHHVHDEQPLGYYDPVDNYYRDQQQPLPPPQYVDMQQNQQYGGQNDAFYPEQEVVFAGTDDFSTNFGPQGQPLPSMESQRTINSYVEPQRPFMMRMESSRSMRSSVGMRGQRTIPTNVGSQRSQRTMDMESRRQSFRRMESHRSMPAMHMESQRTTATNAGSQRSQRTTGNNAQPQRQSLKRIESQRSVKSNVGSQKQPLKRTESQRSIKSNVDTEKQALKPMESQRSVKSNMEGQKKFLKRIDSQSSVKSNVEGEKKPLKRMESQRSVKSNVETKSQPLQHMKSEQASVTIAPGTVVGTDEERNNEDQTTTCDSSISTGMSNSHHSHRRMFEPELGSLPEDQQLRTSQLANGLIIPGCEYGFLSEEQKFNSNFQLDLMPHGHHLPSHLYHIKPPSRRNATDYYPGSLEQQGRQSSFNETQSFPCSIQDPASHPTSLQQGTIPSNGMNLGPMFKPVQHRGNLVFPA